MQTTLQPQRGLISVMMDNIGQTGSSPDKEYEETILGSFTKTQNSTMLWWKLIMWMQQKTMQTTLQPQRGLISVMMDNIGQTGSSPDKEYEETILGSFTKTQNSTMLWWKLIMWMQQKTMQTTLQPQRGLISVMIDNIGQTGSSPDKEYEETILGKIWGNNSVLRKHRTPLCCDGSWLCGTQISLWYEANLSDYGSQCYGLIRDEPARKIQYPFRLSAKATRFTLSM